MILDGTVVITARPQGDIDLVIYPTAAAMTAAMRSIGACRSKRSGQGETGGRVHIDPDKAERFIVLRICLTPPAWREVIYDGLTRDIIPGRQSPTKSSCGKPNWTGLLKPATWTPRRTPRLVHNARRATRRLPASQREAADQEASHERQDRKSLDHCHAIGRCERFTELCSCLAQVFDGATPEPKG